MLLYLIAAFCLSLTTVTNGYSVLDDDYMVLNSESQDLVWPERYTLKASKLSLTSNLVEDFQYWRSNQSSRMDSNGGAVKSIITVDANGTEQSYEIHPEADLNGDSETVCNSFSSVLSTLRLTAEDVLPDVNSESYEIVGNETINDWEAVRFEFSEKSLTNEKKKVIWAAFVEIEGDYTWVPIRYELKEYNSVLGRLETHEIWEFTDFSVTFDDDVFDANEFFCPESTMKIHTPHSDAILKELMFINPQDETHVDHVFNNFNKRFARDFANEEERALRRAIFKQNMRTVRSLNRQNAGYKLEMNHFSDRTDKELERTRGRKDRAPGKSGNIPFPYVGSALEDAVSDLPSDYDLRLYGLVSPIKNQETCGSCWTFGTTAAVEGVLARVNGGRLLGLSNQALVDCVWPFGASGCEGGSDDAAYAWMMEYGLPTEEEYGPYKNKDGYCNIKNMTKIYPIKGYTDVTPFNNDALRVAVVNHGPLSVSVHVTDKFKLYSRGVFYEHGCNPLRLNHEVTLVGYGVRDNELYWIIKNSWGPNWGIEGYMLIAAKDDNCGITTEPTYVSM